MKPGVKKLIGKRIKGVVAKKRRESPQYQIFLIFSDNSYYEFYTSNCSNEIFTISGLQKGGLKKVREYMGQENVVFEAFDDSIRETKRKAVRSLHVIKKEKNPLKLGK